MSSRNSARIDVRIDPQEGGWTAHVTVQEAGTSTTHTVRVRAADVKRLAPSATPEALVRASFEFLVEREPKESILREFDLPVIARYFPEYEEVIRATFANEVS
jgi:hypothetical protein